MWSQSWATEWRTLARDQEVSVRHAYIKLACKWRYAAPRVPLGSYNTNHMSRRLICKAISCNSGHNALFGLSTGVTVKMFAWCVWGMVLLSHPHHSNTSRSFACLSSCVQEKPIITSPLVPLALLCSYVAWAARRASINSWTSLTNCYNLSLRFFCVRGGCLDHCCKCLLCV